MKTLTLCATAYFITLLLVLQSQLPWEFQCGILMIAALCWAFLMYIDGEDPLP